MTPGGSRDLSRPTSASLTHLCDLAQMRLPNLVFHRYPVSIGHIQLVLNSGPLHWLFLLGMLSPRSRSCPFFVSQPKGHLLREDFSDHPRKQAVSPALLYFHSLGDLSAWEGTSVCWVQSFTSRACKEQRARDCRILDPPSAAGCWLNLLTIPSVITDAPKTIVHKAGFMVGETGLREGVTCLKPHNTEG